MQLLKRIMDSAEDEEAIQKRKEEQEERLNQIRVMMDKEKKDK